MWAVSDKKTLLPLCLNAKQEVLMNNEADAVKLFNPVHKPKAK